MALRGGADRARGQLRRPRCSADAPEHPDALAATRSRGRRSGRLERAQTLVERALAAGDSSRRAWPPPRWRCVAASRRTAAASLRRAAQLAPDDPRPRARLAEVYRDASADGDAARALRAPASQRTATSRARRELAELSPEAGRLVEVLDRPLLVTVMGEFNSGKSTFVNALLGEEVAPMGITPTTATINVLKYGAERGGRVVYRDDERARRRVGGRAGAARAGSTPTRRGASASSRCSTRSRRCSGSTSSTRRGSTRSTPSTRRPRAASSPRPTRWCGCSPSTRRPRRPRARRSARSRRQGKKILGVLNKIDRCSPRSWQRIIAHVQRRARRAPRDDRAVRRARGAARAQAAGSGAQLRRRTIRRWPQALEERFFSRARAIKREAATAAPARSCSTQARSRRRTRSSIAGALEPIAAAEAQRARASGVAFDARLPGRRAAPAQRGRRRGLRAPARARCSTSCARAAGRSAPTKRRRPIATSSSSSSTSGWARCSTAAARAREAEAQRAIAVGARRRRRGGDDARFDAELSLLDEQVFGRFRAFARGYLRGGRVDDFFTRVLPKLELNERGDPPRARARRAVERRRRRGRAARAAARWAERFYGGAAGAAAAAAHARSSSTASRSRSA